MVTLNDGGQIDGNMEFYEELKGWFLNDVGLERNELNEYMKLFQDHGYDEWSIIKQVDKDELKDIGLVGDKVANRSKLLKAIQRLH